MARNETSRLVISVDINKATGQIQKLTHQLGQMEAKTVKASQATDRLKTSVSSTGDRAAASAVGFQTMTQGMLNLSTSAVQTYTSLTNLASAEHRVSMAKIGVARAQDLLNAKQLRYDELVARGMGNSRKALNLMKEINTATADMVVKEEKLRIEKAKLNDVWLLFGANIANVTVSMVQTIATMKTAGVSMSVLRAKTAALNYETGGLITRTKMLPAIFTTAGRTAMMSAFGTRTLGSAFRGLYLALGPIGWAITGLTIVMSTWDMHLGKVFGSIEEITGGLLGLSNQMEEVDEKLGDATQSTKGLGEAMEGTSKEIPKLTFIAAQQIAYLSQLSAGYQNTADKIANYNAQLMIARSVGKDVTLVKPPDFRGGGVATPQNTWGVTTDPANIPSWIPTAEGAGAEPLSVAPPKQKAVEQIGITASPLGNIEQQIAYRGLTPDQKFDALIKLKQANLDQPGALDAIDEFMQKAMNEKTAEALGKLPTSQALMRSPSGTNFGFGAAVKPYTPEFWGKEFLREKTGYSSGTGLTFNRPAGVTYIGDKPQILTGKSISGPQWEKYIESQRLAIRAGASLDYGTNTGMGIGFDFRDKYGNIIPNHPLLLDYYKSGRKPISHSGTESEWDSAIIAWGGGLKTITQQLEEHRKSAKTSLGITSASQVEQINAQRAADNAEVRQQHADYYKEISSTATKTSTPSIIRDHGRRKVGMLNGQRGLGGASASTIRGQASRFGTLDQDLQEKLNENIQEWQKSFDEMEDRMEWRIDSWRYMKRWANSIGIGTAETQRERDAQRMQTATGYSNQLPTLSPSEAFKIIKDELQGEQTLIDMLAYQQRLEGMSTGVT